MAVAGGTSTTSAVVTDVLVDNPAPTVTMPDPGTPLSGTGHLRRHAPADTDSGRRQVALQYAATGTLDLDRTCARSPPTPYSCRFDTTALPDGSYAFRAVATDVAGNATTSAVVANRVVDNTVSSVSHRRPGRLPQRHGDAHRGGELHRRASPRCGSSGPPTGTATWTDVCTDTTSPYSCTWNTTTVADGCYDLRAVLLDGAGQDHDLGGGRRPPGRQQPAARRRRADRQRRRARAGRLDAGDVIRLTYTDQVNLGHRSPPAGTASAARA